MYYKQVFSKMRKALVGIAAVLMLTTLVIAIVPAFAYAPTYSFYDPKKNVELDIQAYSANDFNLWIVSPVPDLCDGYGATVKGGVLTIFGRCTYGTYAGKGVLSGGGKLTGPVLLMLTVAGKPPMVMTFFMKQVAPCAYCK
jgi:hypothetical protein